MNESIKSVSIAALEEAIAHSISGLVGEPHVCVITRVELDDPSFVRMDIALRLPMSFESDEDAAPQ